MNRRGRDRLVRQGRLVPAARGWFATAEPDRSALSAIRAGVRLTCVSAARFHGLWTPATPGMHAYGRRGAALPGFIAHSPYLDGWPETGRGEPEPVPAPCGQVSEQRVRRHPVRVGTDHRPALGPEVEGITRTFPLRVRTGLGQLTGLSESGSETRVARWLRGRGVQRPLHDTFDRHDRQSDDSLLHAARARTGAPAPVRYQTTVPPTARHAASTPHTATGASASRAPTCVDCTRIRPA